MALKMDTTNDGNGPEAQRRKARRGVARRPYKARAPEVKHPSSPEGGDIYQPRVERPIGSGALGLRKCD